MDFDKYWHIQMIKPFGKNSNVRIDAVPMLKEPEPIISTGEWEDAQCYNFKTIENGNIVLVREGSRAIALCQIISENFYDDKLAEKYVNTNFRKVKVLAWADDYKQPENTRLFSQGTFSSCRKGTQQYKYIDDWVKYMKNKEFTDKCVRLLKSKHNIILQGAPGTGKTYNTAAIALSILGKTDIDLNNHKDVMEEYKKLQDKQIFFTTFHQSLDYEDFVEGLKPVIQKDDDDKPVGVTYETQDGIFKMACNAAGLDIIQLIDKYLKEIKGFENRKLIPTKSENSFIYVWYDGEKICHRSKNTNSDKPLDESDSPLNVENVKLQALGKGEDGHKQYADAFINAVKKEYYTNEEKPVVLIIDEINRGNISKIFGELITLLESDKRAHGDHPITVTLPYSKQPFSVPDNLYIIGTMNTTDRSTGTLDYALRRRFAFVTLQANRDVISKYYDALGNMDILRDKALALFDDIRTFIKSENHLCSDLSIDDLMVGHSYFMAPNKEELKDKMEYEVIPLINEYINDGILNVSSDEKKDAFIAWKDLKTIEKKEPETQTSDNNNTEGE